MKPNVWLLSLLMLLLAGCGLQATKSIDPMEHLERRAMERWQLLIERNFESAYEYLTEGYRATHSRDGYVQAMNARAPIDWKTVQWMDAECADPASCLARLYITYSLRLPSAGDSESFVMPRERWLYQSGEWQHLPDE